MAKMSKSMSVASRLAAATALTGSMAACETFSNVSDSLFTPSADAPVQTVAARPADPGNPVYIGGSQAANDALYQQTYGAPLQGSGQAIAKQPTYAGSVYQDTSVNAAPLSSVPVQPIATTPSYSTQSTAVETVAYSQPVQTYSPAPEAYSAPAYSAPVQSYSAPVTTTFPTIGTDPVYLPQSSVLQSVPQQSEMFSDASASGVRDIEPLLEALPQRTEPYGSTASIRYSVAEEQLPTVDMTTYAPDAGAQMTYEQDPLLVQDSMLIEQDPLLTENYATAPQALETVEVAALGGGYIPMPRARPTRTAPVLEVASLSTPLPVARPKMWLAPVPALRPAVNTNYTSGAAITDAPALTEAPTMIEVDPIFLDDPVMPTEPEIETASLSPLPAPQLPKVEEQSLTVIKPDDLEAEMASIDTSKLTTGMAVETMTDAAPRIEIADDVGDLKELSGTSWRLSTLNGVAVEGDAELHFDGTSGFAGGQGLCNNYGGEFSETLKGKFDMSNIFSTETECEHFKVEKNYIVALETASKYQMAPGLKELILVGPDGKKVATFEAF